METFNLIFTVLALASSLSIIERSLVLFRKKPNQKELAKKLSLAIKKGPRSALEACKEISSEKISLVAQAGIIEKNSGGNNSTIQEKMDEILVSFTKDAEKRLMILPMIANLSTLMGLVGTIGGLMMGKANLQQGIQQSLDCTALGLGIAVPSLIFYAILKSRASRITDDLNKASLNVFLSLYTPTK